MSSVKSRSDVDPGEPGLVLRDVVAGYSQATVIDRLSFDVRRGECVAILGPNGVGKTTIMRVLSGSVPARDGELHWADHNLRAIAQHRFTTVGIALVPEGRRLYAGMTVEENLLMGAYAVGASEARQRLDRMYGAIPLLKERRGQLAGTMSGGQQQVCAIGRALMSNPNLLLIDELSLGLSPAAIADVFRVLEAAIAQYQPTTIIVDQDVNVAAALASRGYYIDRGAIIASGSMRELMDESLVRDLYFSASSDRRRKEREVDRTRAPGA